MTTIIAVVHCTWLTKPFVLYRLAVLSHVQPRFTCDPELIIHIMHLRKLRAGAAPRRVAARRGEAPLVCCIPDLYHFGRKY